MSGGGWKFRQIRERLNLTYRETEEATAVIATAKLNPDYQVSVSRLFEIENKNVVPSVYRIYSLCATYRVDFCEALRWYGLDLREFQRDAGLFQRRRTHLLAEPPADMEVTVPLRLDPGIDIKKTTYLSRMIQAWGTLPLSLLRQLNTKKFRYGAIGTDDWMMYPLITPGALVQIDPARRRIETAGWRNEFERPIYFLETRDSYVCAWVQPLERGVLLVQPYTLSPCKAVVKAMPNEVEVVGQICGVAMKIGGEREEKARSASDPE